MGFFSKIFKKATKVIPFVASAATGNPAYAMAGLNAWGQESANEQNRALADSTTAFNAAEAAKQRDWSSDEAWYARRFAYNQGATQRNYLTKMSNTSHQREVADLRAAGLNPILAAHGGATTPAASAPTGPAASGSAASGVLARMENAVAPGATTAIAAQRLRNEGKMLREDIWKRQKDTQLTSAQVQRTNEETREVQARISQIGATTARTQAETETIRGNIPGIPAGVSHRQTNAKMAQKNLEILESKMPGVKFEQKMDETEWGKFWRWLGRVDINPFSSTAKTVTPQPIIIPRGK